MAVPEGWQYPTIEAFEAAMRGELAGIALTSAKAGESLSFLVVDPEEWLAGLGYCSNGSCGICGACSLQANERGDVGTPPSGWCTEKCACGEPCHKFASENHSVHTCMIH